MTYVPASASPNRADSAHGAKNIARIFGLVCIIGFIFDIIILGLPPQNNAEWRLGFIQEFANRSIILLLGVSLFTFSSVGTHRRLLKLTSRITMITGVMFFLLCLGSVVDSIRLSQQTLGEISTQESELRSQIDAARNSPEGLPENIDLSDLKRVSQQLTRQANVLRSNTKRTVFKSGVSSIGNLAIVGAGLLGVGRTGMGLSRHRG